MSRRLEGKTALITGSTSGIGKGIALEFACQGARVVVNGRRKNLGEEVVAEIKSNGGEASFYQADVSQQDQIEAMARFVGETYGGLDILVNNAALTGAGRAGRIGDPPGELWKGTSEELWDELYRVGLRGPCLCSKYLMPYLIKSGQGSIINISSITALRGFAMDAYSMVKGGLISLSISMAVSYARDRVRVNCICPGFILVERIMDDTDPNKKFAPFVRQSLTRLGRPQDIAYTAVYLASNESEYVTGAVFNIDGGLAAKGLYSIPGAETA
ncbi:MAG: SDR family oxidoreductase [Deltaproteobacteria bacterium]|nr:SDR family oxidoreductase [Deltaproteobacteria bacterium]